jgi:hypothetical protein
MWRHVRAAFVLFHLCAIFVAGMPSTDSALKRSAWKDPTVRGELDAWAARLGFEEPALEDRLYTFAVAWAAGRRQLERPFSPYLKLTATDQTWQMFVAPHMFPTRFEIAVDRGDGAWDTVFQERSPTATWNAELFGVERFRATIFRWGWGAYAVPYHTGCAALAARLFAEDTTTTKVRCRFWKARSPTPEEARDHVDPPGKYVYPWEVKR